MKYLLVLLVLTVAVWLWRHNRRHQHAGPTGQHNRRSGPAAPTLMVACLHCGTHLPEHEAIEGAGGHYCSQSHRQRHENRMR